LADGDKPSQREARILLWEELKDAATEIERLRDALKFIVAYSDSHEAARDAARQALGEKK